jgi:hypothetical protein
LDQDVNVLICNAAGSKCRYKEWDPYPYFCVATTSKIFGNLLEGVAVAPESNCRELASPLIHGALDAMMINCV